MSKIKDTVSDFTNMLFWPTTNMTKPQYRINLAFKVTTKKLIVNSIRSSSSSNPGHVISNGLHCVNKNKSFFLEMDLNRVVFLILIRLNNILNNSTIHTAYISYLRNENKGDPFQF